MQSIWPQRSIALKAPPSMSVHGPEFLAHERVVRIRELVEPFGRHIDEPALLSADRWSVALIHLGTDGVGGNGTLLVHITNTIQRGASSALHLEVLPYGLIGGSDKERYVPSTAAVVLDTIVERLTEELGNMIVGRIGR